MTDQITPEQLDEIRALVARIANPVNWSVGEANRCIELLPAALDEIDRLNAALSASLEYQRQMEAENARLRIDVAEYSAKWIPEDIPPEMRKHFTVEECAWLDELITKARAARAENAGHKAEARCLRKRIADLEAQLAAATADNPICEPTPNKAHPPDVTGYEVAAEWRKKCDVLEAQLNAARDSTESWHTIADERSAEILRQVSENARLRHQLDVSLEWQHALEAESAKLRDNTKGDITRGEVLNVLADREQRVNAQRTEAGLADMRRRAIAIVRKYTNRWGMPDDAITRELEALS